jgi:pimeloyl-ACP methyl ester carboxylesterase
MTISARPVTSSQETPAYFPSGEEWLFGVLTAPIAGARGTGVILLQGGDHIPSINRNRLWVRIARRLAGDGYHVLRFDYHGVGESTGAVEAFELAKPFTDDVRAAAGWLRAEGVDRVVLVGICFGAATALSCVGRLEGLRGVMACSHPVYELEVLQTLGSVGYVRRVWRSERAAGLLRAARRLPSYLRFHARNAGMPRRRRGAGRASRSLLAQLERIAEQQLPTLFLFGTEDGYSERFDDARAGRLGELLNRAGDAVAHETLDGPLHELISLAVQDAFVDRVVAWLGELERRSPVTGSVSARYSGVEGPRTPPGWTSWRAS